MKQIHENSLLSYWSDGSAEMFSKREQLCIGALRKLGSGTDREVMITLGFSDMNQVRPRLTRLISLGILDDVGSTVCPVTRKTVRRVALHVRETQRELTFPEAVVEAILAEKTA